MSTNRRPSLARVLNIDFAALAAWLYPLLFWVIYGLVWLFNRAGAADWRLLAAVLGTTGVGAAALAWRVGVFMRVFAEGMTAEAVVSGLGFYRGGGHVAYTYGVDGQTVTGGNAVTRDPAISGLRVGQAVTVVVDPRNPRRAFIRDLYL